FDNAKGFIFGRPVNSENYMGVSHKYAIMEILKDLNVPIVLGADIGHLPPTMTLINGAFANVISKNNKLTIDMICK
ncbi:MAG: LD-carboxypeptidase, partial [Bacilli bacterium]|nr:LD-carboxypeptidase [Bacilli bacterium]